MRKLLSLGIILASAALVSCGGGDGDTITTGGGGGATTTGDVIVEMGSGTPPAFTAGLLQIQSASLSAGGSTSLTVSFVADGTSLYTSEVTVNFSSVCIASDLANIKQNGVEVSEATTSTGILTVSYSAAGCVGDDVITATATIDGTILQATGTVNVAASTVGSIEFESATPTLIGLRGTGGVGIRETSDVVFRVVDKTGGPSSGRTVNFSLNSNVGGIELNPPTAISGADGRVQTTVRAGTVATTIRVTAVTDDDSGTPISTQSSQLTITTGLPDQNSVSMAVACHNVEAFDVDGTTNDVTVRLADRFNNPVPDGTGVTVSTEGGKITGSCVTTTVGDESGLCTVEWVSQNPRPADLGAQSPAGRSTVYMHTIGEEFFDDVNGNGFFDDGDTFDDLGEPFRDDDEDGVRDPTEPFFDFDGDSTFDAAGDGLFNGLLCGGPDGSADTLNRCAPEPTTAITTDNIIIMSGSTANFMVSIDGGPFVDPSTVGALTLPKTIAYQVFDNNIQPMPADSTIIFDVTNGESVGDTNFTQACTSFNGPIVYSVFIAPDTTSDTGYVSISVETPGGVVTSGPVIQIDD